MCKLCFFFLNMKAEYDSWKVLGFIQRAASPPSKVNRNTNKANWYLKTVKNNFRKKKRKTKARRQISGRNCFVFADFPVFLLNEILLDDHLVHRKTLTDTIITQIYPCLCFSGQFSIRLLAIINLALLLPQKNLITSNNKFKSSSTSCFCNLKQILYFNTKTHC